MTKSSKKELIKFLPSYVGSKAYWVNFLLPYKGQDFIETFSGSGVLSANLAKSAILNDLDPMVYKIFSNYEKLIVPKVFTTEDYFKYRSDKEWWKYIFCLQKMSFSGVFRYSKNGFNVPIKKDLKKKEISVQDDFKAAKKRFKELNPTILNLSYQDIPLENFKDKVVILDPPYEGSQAAYNRPFDYKEYWEFVKKITPLAKAVILFDKKDNLEKAGYEVLATRKMRVNGARPGDMEAVAIVGLNLIKKEP